MNTCLSQVNTRDFMVLFMVQGNTRLYHVVPGRYLRNKARVIVLLQNNLRSGELRLFHFKQHFSTSEVFCNNHEFLFNRADVFLYRRTK